MSHQTTLQEFYKSKASPPPGTMLRNTGKKRCSLSLIKPLTPKKCPKIQSSDVSVINLVSDDENLTEDQEVSSSQNSVQSSSSISVDDKVIAPSTPHKSPVSSSNQTSPRKEKFFSPVKKRAVFKTPTKRNLARELNGTSPTKQISQDEDFVKACEGMDDKSIFLLTIINKFLKNDKLRHLLDESSVNLLSQCLHLIKPGIRLVCRLYWRQHNWFREEQLVNISSDKNEHTNENFQSMINCLIENGLLVTSSGAATNIMSFDDMAKVLKSDELKLICKDLKMKMQKKEDAIDALRKFMKRSSISKYFMGKTNNSDNSKRVMQMMRSNLGTCYKLSELASMTLYKLYLLMYLGMNYSIIREKKLEITLINSKIKTETHPTEGIEMDDASVVFKDRDDFIKYLKAHIIYENYLSETESSEKCKMVRDAYRRYQTIDKEDMERYKSVPIWLRRYTPAHIYVKILANGIQELKKEKCTESYELSIDILSTLISQDLFRQHKKAEWYAEKGLILHKLLARYDEAAQVLIEGLKSDLSEEEKDIIRPRALKLANQHNISVREDLVDQLIELSQDDLILENSFPAEHINKQHMENPGVQRGKKKFVVDTLKGRLYLDAEDYCAYHYKNTGDYTDAEHWEGRIITTIFFLLFWEIIYSKPRGVPGIFLSPYQIYPLDMYCEGFYQNRKRLIDDRLTAIRNMETDELIDVMQHTMEARPEQELSGIHRHIQWDDIRGVVRCAGARRVAAACERLATDYRRYSGFPDLTVWNVHTGQIKFIEVKTDTDKPSRKQLQWMQYLKDNDIQTGFCYIGAFTTKCKARALGNIAEITECDDEAPDKVAPRTPQKSPLTPRKSKTPKKGRALAMSKKAPDKAPRTPNKNESPRTPRLDSRTPDNIKSPKETKTSEQDEVFESPKKSRARPKINIRSVADINKTSEIS